MIETVCECSIIKSWPVYEIELLCDHCKQYRRTQYYQIYLNNLDHIVNCYYCNSSYGNQNISVMAERFIICTNKPHLKYEYFPTSSMKTLTNNLFDMYLDEYKDKNIESVFISVKILYFNHEYKNRFILDIEENTEYWCNHRPTTSMYYCHCDIGTNQNFIHKYLGTDVLDAVIIMEIINHALYTINKKCDSEEILSEIVYRYNYQDIFDYFDNVLLYDIKPYVASYLI